MAKIEDLKAAPAEGTPQAAPGEDGAKPRAVFAMGREITEGSVREQFRGEGVDLSFVENPEQLLRDLHRPECFAVFASLAFKGDLLGILRNRSPAMRAFWAMSVPQITARQSAALFQSGVSDLLSQPVHPLTLKNRARALLSRYYSKHGFPVDVELPAWLNQYNKEQAPRATIAPTGLHAPAAEAQPHKRKKGGGAYHDPVLKEVDERIVELSPQAEVDASIWGPPVHADHSNGRKMKNLDEISDHIRLFFEHCKEILKAKRITLVSFKELADDDFPENFYSLISSEGGPGRNDPIESKMLPQLCVTLDRDTACYLDARVPAREDEPERKADWLVDGNTEEASAMMPLRVGHRIYAMLFVQFDRAVDPSLRPLLDQAAAFMKGPANDYKSADHLCRIYRKY